MAEVEPSSDNEAAGSWQPDPSGRHQLRFRAASGEWTDHVADGSAVGRDPMPAISPPPPEAPSRGKRTAKGCGVAVAALLGLLIVLAVVGLLLGDNGDTDMPASTALSDHEIECARDYDDTLSISQDRMRWLKEDRSRDGIFSWSNGHWVSYGKVMDLCRILSTTSTTPTTVTTPKPGASDSISEADCRQAVARAQFLGESWAQEGQAVFTAAFNDATLAYDVAMLTYDQMMGAAAQARDCSAALGWTDASNAIGDLIDISPSLRNDLRTHCEAAFAPFGFDC